MASQRKRRKISRLTPKAASGGLGPHRHPDGDRRRKGSADAAVAAKARAQRWTIDAAGNDVLLLEPTADTTQGTTDKAR